MLWENRIGRPDIPDALLFGFINGLVGITAWRLFLYFYPTTSKIPLKTYLLNLVAAHEVFALTVKGIISKNNPDFMG